MKKITLMLLLIQSAFMMAQTKTVVTQYGEKVTINPYANNGLEATGGYIQLGGTLIQNTTLKATPSATLALLGLQEGASTDKILVADPTTGVLKLVDRSTFGDNLGNHTATQDLNMNNQNILAAAKTTTANAQITTGAGAGRIAVSDAAGNVTWTDPSTISVAGDNLGNHTAIQNLVMGGNDITNAANITATVKTTTAAAQITNAAGAGRIAVSDAAGNVTWTEPSTISVAGDNLGNHTATQDLNMNNQNILAAAKTTTANAQITTGAGAGKIAVSDAAGNVTWTDPATISVAGDNLGNHTATQDLNMNNQNILAAAKTTTATAQITTGAGAGRIAVSDATGNVTWTDPATISVAGDNLGNHTATQNLVMGGNDITNAANITATVKTTTAAAQITAGAGAGKIAVSDAAGNVTWTDPATISVAGDNLGNHTATQNLAMGGNNINNAANITATVKTTTAAAQITNGAGAGKIAVSDATGNVTWTDPLTITTITPEMVIDEFNVATNGTATFILSKTPTPNAKFLFHVNGVCISRTATSLSGNTVTYDPDKNASYGLLANDLIRITYLQQ